MVTEHDPLVLSYSHLRDFPRAADALLLLKKVASLVKPIMRARSWRVGELAEFYPDQANLLGKLPLPLNLQWLLVVANLIHANQDST